MPVRENKAKQLLRAGGTIYSSSVRLPEPGLCELLGYAGFDFVLIDGEHGAVDASSSFSCRFLRNDRAQHPAFEHRMRGDSIGSHHQPVAEFARRRAHAFAKLLELSARLDSLAEQGIHLTPVAREAFEQLVKPHETCARLGRVDRGHEL